MSTFNTPVDPGSASGAPQGQFNNQPKAADQPATVDVKSTPQDLDVAKILKRLDDSQKFIEQLKQERQEDRKKIEALETRKVPALEEIMDTINQQRPVNDNAPDSDELVKVVYEKLNQDMTRKEVMAKEQSNFQEVLTTLQSKFGDDIDSHVGKIASDVGMTLEEVVALAKRNPKAVYKLLGVAKSTVPASSYTSSPRVNPQGIAPVEAPRNTNILKAKTSKERIEVMNKKLQAVISRS